MTDAAGGSASEQPDISILSRPAAPPLTCTDLLLAALPAWEAAARPCLILCCRGFVTTMPPVAGSARPSRLGGRWCLAGDRGADRFVAVFLRFRLCHLSSALVEVGGGEIVGDAEPAAFVDDPP